MTLSKGKREVIETPEGVGQVLRDCEAIAKVRYSLVVETVEMFAVPFVQRTNRTGLVHKSVSGVLLVLEGEIAAPAPSAPSGPFTLVMADGREADFFVTSCVTTSGPTRQECTITGSGNRL